MTASVGVVHTPDDTVSRLGFRYSPSDPFSAGVYLAHSMRNGMAGGAELGLTPSDALRLGARLERSERDGASGGLDMKLRPMDALTIGARVERSEREGVCAALDMRYLPPNDLVLTERVALSNDHRVAATLGTAYKPHEHTSLDIKVGADEAGGTIMGGVKINLGLGSAQASTASVMPTSRPGVRCWPSCARCPARPPRTPTPTDGSAPHTLQRMPSVVFNGAHPAVLAAIRHHIPRA